MIHAWDSFLKHLQTQLTAQGLTLVADSEAPLALNKVTATLLTSAPRVTMNPGLLELIVSLDVMAEGTATERAARKALGMAAKVDAALATPWIKKQNWSNPAAPVDLGTFVSWRPWGPWKRVPDNEQYAHLNRTISLLYMGERV